MTTENKLQWSDNIIRDHFTQDGYIQEDKGLHGALRFTFRPMLAEETEALESFRDKHSFKQPGLVRAKIASEVQQRLLSWSEKIGGEPAPITEKNVRKLRFALGTKLYNIIAGLMPTDIDEESTKDDELGDFGDLEPLEALVESPEQAVGK